MEGEWCLCFDLFSWWCRWLGRRRRTGGGGCGEVRTVELDRSGLTLLGMTVL